MIEPPLMFTVESLIILEDKCGAKAAFARLVFDMLQSFLTVCTKDVCN